MPGSAAIEKIVAGGLFDRLPATFATYTFDRIREWEMLFPAEQTYFERLLGLLDRSPREAVAQTFAPLAAVESKMDIDRREWNTREFNLGHVDFLQRSPHYSEWRNAVTEVFAKVDPLVEEETARQGRPCVAIVLAPAELPVGPERMWLRMAARGKRIALDVPEGLDPKDYTALLLTGAKRAARRPTLLELGTGPAYSSWLVESGTSVAPLMRPTAQNVVLSYDQLEAYRTKLMQEVRGMLEAKQLRGPRELGAELRKLKTSTPPGQLGQNALMADFLRSVLLAGNGTLLINNTFAEWGTVQAIRRARPVVTVTSFGIRNKVKPFSSLLIYSDQEIASPVPTQTDTLGTYVDLEVFYQYVWQEYEKYAEYRRNTVYVFAAEGMEELMVVAPADFGSLRAGKVGLERVHGELRAWLG